MGYYANKVQGDPFTIYEPTKVLDFLATYFPKTAWKDMVETARQEAGATDTQVLLDLLLTFGFFAEFDQYNLRVFSFDGKWMTFVTNLWDAFPLGMRNFETAWIMRGEDGEMWAEVITSDGHRGAKVSVSYTVEV